MKRYNFLLSLLLSIPFFTFGQPADGKVTINGQTLPYMIDECGDTLILASLDGVSVSSLREFEDDADYKRYLKYRRYAAVVYPYAVEAIKVFRELEMETEQMKKKQRKKYTKQLHKDLKDKFTDPLKKLTKTQGLILVKMIEKELDTPMYYLIKDLRNGVTARKWAILGGMFGHKLRRGYIEGEDPILDAVLNDLDISHQVTED